MALSSRDDLLLELTRRYSEPWRRYHDLSHLAHLFGLARDRQLALSDVQVWALWFHDAVYDPQATDNEERSAELARERLGGSLDREATDEVAAIVLDTKRHEPSRPSSRLVLDLDLSVLGADPVTYRRYLEGIRFEYGFVDDAAWRVGRRGYVERFLERARAGELFFELDDLHAPAARNLAAELGSLG